MDTQDRFALPPAPTDGLLGLETPSVQHLGFRDLLVPLFVLFSCSACVGAPAFEVVVPVQGLWVGSRSRFDS